MIEPSGSSDRRRPKLEDFLTLADNLPEAAWIADAEGSIFWYNQRWYEYTGTSPAEMEGWGWESAHHPDMLPKVLIKWKAALTSGEAFEMVFPLRGADGIFRPFLTRVKPSRDAAGNVIRWFGTNTEISVQQAMMDDLRIRSHALETLNATAAIVAAELDLEKLVQTVTDAGVQLTGAQFGAFFYNLVDAAGESYTLYTISGVPREHFSQFPMPRNTHIFEPTFRGDGVVRSDDITKDPRYGHFAPHFGMPEGHLPVTSYLAAPVKSSSGEVMGGLLYGHAKAGVFNEYHEQMLVGLAAQAAVGIDNARLYEKTMREVEDRRSAQAALLEREADLRLLLDSTAGGFYAVDRNGVTTRCNLAFIRMLGFEREEDALGRKLHSVIHHTHPDGSAYPREECPIYRTAQSGEPAHVPDELFFRLDGSSFPVEYWVMPVFRDGQLQGAVCSFIDITDRKRTDEVQHLMLRELNHRVKNLFAIASGMVNMTARTASTPREMAKTLNGRLSALARAHELIRAGISAETSMPSFSSLRDLVSAVTEPHHLPGIGRVTIHGPEIKIGVAAATNLALVLHELATNAGKYGALSVSEGSVEITWRIVGDDMKLAWREREGPALLAPPTRAGFGTQLAQASAAGQLGGSIHFDWKPEGLDVTLTASMERLLQ